MRANPSIYASIKKPVLHSQCTSIVGKNMPIEKRKTIMRNEKSIFQGCIIAVYQKVYSWARKLTGVIYLATSMRSALTFIYILLSRAFI